MKTILILSLFAFLSCSSDPVQDTPVNPTEPTQDEEPSTPPQEPSPDEQEPSPDEPELGPKKIAEQVDSYYNSNQLLKKRGDTTFADSIYTAVKESVEKERTLPLSSYLKGLFSIESDKPVSLKEKQCEYSNAMAQRLIRTSISSSGVELINKFVSHVNSLETDEEYTQAYSKFMMCLAYSESLGDPDTSRSKTIASREGVQKAEGVKYYFDSLQTNPDSQINIGLYQFSPVKGGNIYPCLTEFGPSDRSRKDLVQTLGAQDQEWNARCGVHKILSLFYVSKNTTSSKRKAGESCVSLHNRNAYNHFGPLQREGNPGGGFTKLYKCFFSE